MGRAIRKVPANWDHPKDRNGNFIPLFDETFESAAEDWKQKYAEWEINPPGNMEYWEYSGGPPDRASYRTYGDEEAVWFQAYETVSEGTPVTPPFATKNELINYLAEHGDFWDQHRGEVGGWGLECARAFVEDEWVPTMMIADGNILEAKDIALAWKK